jgi:hypothetical protein
MAFGIDTIRSHLDQLPSLLAGGNFYVWNGGAPALFAGRNFLGGDFIWGHAEATNASSELAVSANGAAHFPLPAGAPSPDHPENLTLTVDRVTPLQAPHHERQQFTDDKGILFGQIDADAICTRLVGAILAGEFGLSETQLMHVWLSVDSTVPFSDDYWAGWADTVNHFPLPIYSQGVLLAQVQPFRAAVLCSYVAGTDGKFRPEPHVVTALASKHPGMNTSVHGRWADLKVWDNAPADLVANGSPQLNWDQFDPPTAPVLWRFAHGFVKSDGTPAGLAFDVDAVSPSAEPLAFMLQPQKWQPNVTSIQNVGFSNLDVITAAQAKCLQSTLMQDMDDINFVANAGHFHVPGGPVAVVGRYIKQPAAASMGAPEAQLLSDASIQIFTCWQGFRTLGGVAREPRVIDYFNPDPDGNPATADDAGTLDGKDAFHYCGTVLKQLPQTPIFFALDFDPYDPASANAEAWIKNYFSNIKAARDAFATQTGRYYLLGVYGVGKIMQLLYEQGFVSHFWQSDSTGRNGNRPPNWPWYHVNRWQYQANKAICGIGGINAKGDPFGIDPDADWGNGGIWSLTTQLSEDLDQLERIGVTGHFHDWGDLLDPPPVPPPPPSP